MWARDPFLRSFGCVMAIDVFVIKLLVPETLRKNSGIVFLEEHKTSRST
jgi:hypothetical protein